MFCFVFFSFPLFFSWLLSWVDHRLGTFAFVLWLHLPIVYVWKNQFSRVPQVFTRYGKCYTFNAGGDGRPPRMTTKGGMGNGLELMLDIQQDEYLPVWGETGEGNMSPLSGHLLVCHILTVYVHRCFATGGCEFNTSGKLFITLFVTFVDETSFEAGIKVQIHSQDEPSFIDQLGFGVAPGFQTFVSCQEQRVYVKE